MKVSLPCLSHFRNGRFFTPLFLAATILLLLAPRVAPAQTSVTLAGRPLSHTPQQVLTGKARLTQSLDEKKMLRLALALTPPHPDQQRLLIDQLHDKKSPEFHKFLTADQWNTRFAPSAEDEEAVVKWAQSQGLTVTHRYKSRLLVDVEAPVGTIQKAFNVTMGSYEMDGKSYFANERDPELPSALSQTLQAVIGLNSFIQMRPASFSANATLPDRPAYVPGPVAGVPQTQSGSGSKQKLAQALKASAAKKAANALGSPQVTDGNYDPTDIYSSNGYNVNGLDALGHCCNPTGAPSSPPESSIAIASFGDVSFSDMAGFHNQYPYLAWLVTKIPVDGGYTCVGYDDNCYEVTMDSEWSTALANSFGSQNNTAQLFVYEGANFGDMADLYTQMMDDGKARVTSISWGCEEACFGDGTPALDNIWSSMVGQGWTLIAAAGDNGATAGCGDGDALLFPGSDPNFLSAGGNNMSLDSNGGFENEVAWTGDTFAGACGDNLGGGTGGFSGYYATPAYQSGMGFGSRAVPDMALNAIHFQNLYFDGGVTANAGTSIVAPELAGFFAQTNAYGLAIGNACGAGGNSACAPLGNADYFLYDEGKSPTAAHYPFYDITSGCNTNDITAEFGLGYYCAGTGYDEVTGWGSANMLQLAWAINWFHAGAFGGPSVNFTGPAINTWYNSNQIVGWTISDNVTNAGGVPTGIAGFTQGWDSIPGDSYTAGRPATGDSFFAGPQFPNATGGCLALGSSGCAGNVSQGCHTAYVRAWNNMGITSGAQAYGPICYDTIAPSISAAFSGTKNGSIFISGVRVSLAAADSGSGVQSIIYQLDGAPLTRYSAPLNINTAGAHKITYYSTDVAGNQSTTSTNNFSIESPTSTKLASSVTSTIYGDSVTLTATVADTFGALPTGNITFRSAAGTIGTAALSSGKATLVTSALPVGSNSITAVYPGSAANEASTSTALVVGVRQASTGTQVVTSRNPAPFDAPVTFTATVKSLTSGLPTGNVVFKNGTATLGSVALTGGKAIYSTSALPIGSHSITAVYGGSTDYAVSTSAALNETVQQETTTTTVASSLNPSPYDKAVTLTATVRPGVSGVPTGSVTFKNSGATLGTVNLNSGKAVLTTSALTVGTHSIVAVYSGNADYVVSTSPALTETIAKAATTTRVLSSVNPALFGQTITLTAEVASTSPGTLTGTVTFKNGGATLGTTTVSGGKAVLSSNALTVGTHAITAVYNGATDYNTSTAATLNVVVKQATTTTTLASSLNPSTSGKAITFTAVVRPSTGVATGVMNFMDGSTKIGTETLASGKATFTTNGLAVGTHSIQAVYVGATDFATSKSSVLAERVNQ